MDLRLLFHNLGFGSGALIALVFAIFVYYKDRKSPTNILFGLSFLSIAIFCGSHVIGVNILDPIVSQHVLMWNLSVIFIACFLTHCSFSLAGVVEKQKVFLYFMYIGAVVLTTIHIFYPETYLLPSEPKMYFPNYYVAGNLQWIMRVIFDIIVPVYFLGYLIYAYTKADLVMKNRLKYFFFSLTVGYTLGSLAIPLVFDIQIDPLYASFFVPILAIPMAYAIVQYSLLDIRVITKKALIFAFIIAFSSIGIFMVGYGNYIISLYFIDFPVWLVPLFGGSVATVIGYIVWRRFRESDILKYEFITVVTHKLRTPLTAIKWSAENLAPNVSGKGFTDLENIKKSVNSLVEITNIITTVSSEDQDVYLYHNKNIDMNELCNSIILEYIEKGKVKNIEVKVESQKDSIMVNIDQEKIRLVLQILLDNAVSYTPVNGNVKMILNKDDDNAIISISDTGIGMDKDGLGRIFNSFYRGSKARSTETEGMGIGLFMAKKIMERHKGKINVESEGQDKGSTFTIKLPLVKGK